MTYTHDVNLPKAIICDLDGTLSLLNGRNPYDASTCHDDPPNLPVVECVKAMYARGHEVLFMSGREDKDRVPTEQFLAQHVVVDSVMSSFLVYGKMQSYRPIPHQLFMRPTGDQRKDSVIKAELFEAHVRDKYNVVFVLDDRDQVVQLWRDMGLTCFQVGWGAF